MCTKIIMTFKLLFGIPTILFVTFLSHENLKVDAASFGMFGNDRHQNSQDTRQESHNFFDQISKVPISLFDITAMYANATSQATTKNCPICRTPIALWVLNSLSPCHDIKKEDCPIGLVCCHLPPDVLPANNLKRSDVEIYHEDWNEKEFDHSTFEQDPIPGDS